MRFSVLAVVGAIASLSAAAPLELEERFSCARVVKNPSPPADAYCGTYGNLENPQFQGTPGGPETFIACRNSCIKDPHCKSFLWHPIEGTSQGLCAPYTVGLREQGYTLTGIFMGNVYYSRSCYLCV